MSINKLNNIFFEEYGTSLEDIAKAQNYNDNLRNLFSRSRRFAVYGTQIPDHFYVALLSEIVPGYHLSQAKPIQYRIKRPWKVDGRLIRMLQAEGAEETPCQQHQEAHKILEYQPVLGSEVNSLDELKVALIEITKHLTVNHPQQFATVATLSKKFRDHYGQPIRTTIRTVCPSIKLIDLLQAIPNLHLQKVNNDWQIYLKSD